MVVKSPELEFDRWDLERKDDDAGIRMHADRNFVTSVTVYPDRAEVTKILKMLPGLARTFAGELAQMSGISRTATRKKL